MYNNILSGNSSSMVEAEDEIVEIIDEDEYIFDPVSNMTTKAVTWYPTEGITPMLVS